MPKVHVDLSPDLKEALQVWAKAHDRSISNAIRVLLTQALASQDTSQPQEIQR